MHTFNVTRTSPALLEKMTKVLQLLRRERQECEQAASLMEEGSMKQMMWSLAQESNQYASEWQSQINTLGGEAQDAKPVQSVVDSKLQKDETELMDMCDSYEHKLVDACQEVLEYPGLYEDVKKMVLYQLVKIQGAFLQFRIMRNLTPSAH